MFASKTGAYPNEAPERQFIISQRFFPGRPFQLNLIFVGYAGSLP
jgi:hypothetical protein